MNASEKKVLAFPVRARADAGLRQREDGAIGLVYTGQLPETVLGVFSRLGDWGSTRVGNVSGKPQVTIHVPRADEDILKLLQEAATELGKAGKVESLF